MEKKTKNIILTFVGIIAIAIGSWWLYLANRNQTETAFDFVKRKGATKTKATNVGDRYDYGDYGFYSNNRAVQFSTKKKGTYTKVSIKWDDGSETKMIDIFK